MTEPRPRDDLLSGKDESTPFRVHNRVFLVVAVVAILVGGLVYGIYAAVQ